MTASSSAAADWDYASTPTAASDSAAHRLNVHEETEALAPTPPPDPTERPNSTRAVQAREALQQGTLLNLSRKIAAQHATAKPLAEWQGHVTRIEGDRLYATMEGVFGAGVEGKTHEAVIPLTEVAPEDLPLVRSGAYFRLSVAYAMSQGIGGTFTRISTLVFRRLPAYHAAELARAREIAQELLGGIRLE